MLMGKHSWIKKNRTEFHRSHKEAKLQQPLVENLTKSALGLLSLQQHWFLRLNRVKTMSFWRVFLSSALPRIRAPPDETGRCLARCQTPRQCGDMLHVT